MDPLTSRKLRPLLPRSTTLMVTRNTTSSSYSTPPPQSHTGVPTTPSMKKQVKTIPSRWCPVPQQVHALREMYRSGLRTPTTSQIEQIASRLGRFGKIEGKNVFYWFQNHKARERQKLRRRLKPHLHPQQQQRIAPTFPQESAPIAMARHVASESSTSGNRELTPRAPPVAYSVTDVTAVCQNVDKPTDGTQTLELFPLLSNGRRRRSILGLHNVENDDSTSINRQRSSPKQFFEFFPVKN